METPGISRSVTPLHSSVDPPIRGSPPPSRPFNRTWTVVMERSKSVFSENGKYRTSSVWFFCGRQTSRSALVFVSQITILYIAIITCFINLSLRNGSSELWITILSLSLGSILPSPKVKNKKESAEGDGYYAPTSHAESEV